MIMIETCHSRWPNSAGRALHSRSPRRHGRLGALELCVLAEEPGRVLAPVPFFGTVCLAAEILKRTDQAGDLLGRIAAGQAVVAVE